MTEKAPSLKDIAEKAGCSVSVVSTVLNKSKGNVRVGKELRTSILNAAEALNYQPNYHAKALNSGRSQTLGLIMDASPGNRAFVGIEAGVQEAAQEAEYDLLMITGTKCERAGVRGERYVSERRLDAVICAASYNARLYKEQGGEKAVVVEGSVDPFPSVRLDAEPGMRAAAKHLAELGHTDVLYLGKAASRHIVLQERLDAFRSACKRNGIALDECFIPREEFFGEVDQHLEYNYEQLKTHLDLPEAATAVVCYNDTLAMALVDYLREQGMHIPQDMSIIGFDDVHATHCRPGLTTVSHMYREMGARAVEVALRMVEGESLANEVFHVPARLVVRGSTVAPQNRSKS
jgi:LacI family transcriptional regulator